VATINNYNGANERVFDAMSCACILFSESSPELIEKISFKENVYYSPNNANKSIEILNEKIKTTSNEIGHKNMSLFNLNHTWTNRANYLINLTSEMRG
jgi:spore maturation protein CgeB